MLESIKLSKATNFENNVTREFSPTESLDTIHWWCSTTSIYVYLTHVVFGSDHQNNNATRRKEGRKKLNIYH